MHRNRIVVLVGVLLATIGCDQGTKRLAEATLKNGDVVTALHGTVRLLYTENTGAWGSLGATWPPVWKLLALTVLPVFVLVGLLVHALRQRDARLGSMIGPALIVGGGLGNLIDRVLHGHVIDFLWMGVGGLGTNVFNVADVALVVGIGLLLLQQRRPKHADTAPAGDS